MRFLASSHVKISSLKRCHLLRRTFASRMETFQWAEKARSPAKQNVNGRLAELAKDVWSEIEAAEKWALVLDAPSMSSSSALLSAGFRPQRIVVPNDSDAPFPSNSASKALVMKGLSLNQFLKRNHRNRGHQVYGPFSCVYCDFTQCLDGSWRPSQELEEPTQSLLLAQAEYASPLEDSWHWGILRFPIPTLFFQIVVAFVCRFALFGFNVVFNNIRNIQFYSRPCQDLKDLQSLFLGHLEHQDAVLLAVTLAHLRSPQRHPSTNRRSGIIDQWQRLRLLLGTLAHRNGLCSVAVERLELKGVATEFWLLGKPGSKRLEEALKKQLERTEGMLVWSEIWLRFFRLFGNLSTKTKNIARTFKLLSYRAQQWRRSSLDVGAHGVREGCTSKLNPVTCGRGWRRCWFTTTAVLMTKWRICTPNTENIFYWHFQNVPKQNWRAHAVLHLVERLHPVSNVLFIYCQVKHSNRQW